MPSPVPPRDFAGLDENLVRELSGTNGDPDWMRELRLSSLRHFQHQPLPTGAADLSEIRFDEIDFRKPTDRRPYPTERRPSPDEAADLSEAELAFHRTRETLDRLGVVFCDLAAAVREYPELVKPYFGAIVPAGDNKFAALNTTVWSGGSFVYVPPGVEVDQPLQAFSRVAAEKTGQFERTLIVADEGSKVHYIEGCSAPVYSADSLHAAVVEIVVKPSAQLTYSTVQNWSSNVYNLVTKRAHVEAEGQMVWVDGNIGSRATMAYPAVRLAGPRATGKVLSVAFAGHGQHQHTGAEMVHAAAETSSEVVSKSISKDGGRAIYRGLVRVEDGAAGCSSKIRHDALLLDDDSTSVAKPATEIEALNAQISNEAAVSMIEDQQLFYLMSRGLSQEQAVALVVNGFIRPVTAALPMEYAVEWSRLIELQMEGGIG